MTTASPESPDVAEIRALLRDYIDWFSAGDSARIAREAYDVPFQGFLPTGPASIASVETLELALTAYIGAMRLTGYSRSTISEPVVSLLDNRAALASGTVTRYRADGTVIETLGSSYLLGKSLLHGWRIISNFTHPAGTVVRTVPATS
jgi:hypothetical protein